MAWLRPDVPRHVHGDPRHSGRGDVAADDPERARDFAGGDELDPDRLSDRRGHRHSADRLADARADDALAVRRRDRRLHPGLDRLRASGSFATLVTLPRAAGICGRHADSGGVSAVFLLFPARTQGVATTIAGIMAVLAPTVGPVVGGWITHLFLALAVSDQCRSRAGRGARHAVPAAARQTSVSTERDTRRACLCC